MIYMMINIFPDPVLKASIYKFAVVFLLIAAGGSALWVKLVMKKGLFELTPLEKLTEELASSDNIVESPGKITG